MVVSGWSLAAFFLNHEIHGIHGNVELKIVSTAFGEELERVWEWCDVLVLPTLSENFGLVVAEALERGKRVITTDGAPVWGAPYINTNENRYYNICTSYGSWSVKKPRWDVDSSV